MHIMAVMTEKSLTDPWPKTIQIYVEGQNNEVLENHPLRVKDTRRKRKIALEEQKQKRNLYEVLLVQNLDDPVVNMSRKQMEQ